MTKRTICTVVAVILLLGVIGINLSFAYESQQKERADELLLIQEKLLSQQNQFAGNSSIDLYDNLETLVKELHKGDTFASSFCDMWFSHNPLDLEPIKGTTWIFTFSIGTTSFSDTITFGNLVTTTSDGIVGIICNNEYYQKGAVFYSDLIFGGRGFSVVISGSILDEFYHFNVSGNTAYGKYSHKVRSTGHYSNLYSMTGIKISGPSQPQCRYDNLPGCTTQTDCQNVGGYWYNSTCNANTQPQCRYDNLSGCTTLADCSNAGGYWYDRKCNTTPQSQCGPANLDLCSSSMDCSTAGGYWYDRKCNFNPQPSPPSPVSHNAAPSHALPVVIFPTGVNPGNNIVQVGACDDIMIQPTLSVPSADLNKTATLIMYIYIPDAGFGMNVPPKTKILTSETKFDLLSHAIDFSEYPSLNFYIYYGYVLGSTTKYNVYSVMVGSSCDNAVPNCRVIGDASSCNGTDGCEWQGFPAPGCILKCSQFTSQSECRNAFGGACEWSATPFGDICAQK